MYPPSRIFSIADAWLVVLDAAVESILLCFLVSLFFSLGNRSSEVGHRPVLGLRGVASVGSSARRFEINLGQQNHGEGLVEWELRIEHRGSEARPLRYRLVPMSTEAGEAWLSFSPSAGTLTHPHETQVCERERARQRAREKEREMYIYICMYM